MTTPQEAHWAGPEGDAYQTRNAQAKVGSIDANVMLFNKVLAAMPRHPESIIEFGAGSGNNLKALRCLLPNVAMAAVEINDEAANQIDCAAVWRGSLLDYPLGGPGYDLAFTKGVLIHVAPKDLPRAYAVLHAASRHSVLMVEYYSPKPRMIRYHGYDDRLWARDFAGEFLDTYPDMVLVSTGFAYHRDRYPQDDVTWFLMEKR